MLAQSVAEILTDHVTLTVESLDRIYLNVYVPKLQYPYGAVKFFRDHRGQPRFKRGAGGGRAPVAFRV